jgi:hypothetical protein
LHLAAAAAVLGNVPLKVEAASLPKENDASIRLFSSEEEAELEKVSLPSRPVAADVEWQGIGHSLFAFPPCLLSL